MRAFSRVRYVLIYHLFCREAKQFVASRRGASRRAWMRLKSELAGNICRI